MRLKLALKQISEVEDDATLYKGIGRAFVSTSKRAVIDQFDDDFKQEVEGLDKQKGQKKRLEDSVQSSERELRELLNSTPAVGHQYLASAQ